MNNKDQIFIHFADLLSYPEPNIQEHTEHLLKMLSAWNENVGIEKFAQFIQEARHSDVEELFTSTFDMNAACCLEIGWHLFGEDYRRGEFLVQMRQSLAEEQLPESGELPDHISSCLRLITRLDLDDASEFARSYLLPAISKIISGFKDADANPYYCVISALQDVLKNHFDIKDADVPHPSLRVLNNQPQVHKNHKGNNIFMV